MSTQNSTSIHHLLKKKPPVNSPTVSPSSKEADPFPSNNKEVTIHEVVEHEEKDPQLAKHVEVRKDVPEIPPDLKKLGITTHTISSFSTYQPLKLPLDEDKLPTALHAPISESIRWLGELTKFLLLQSRGSLKAAHQNVVQNIIRMIGKGSGK